jgi:hypothetical protein
MGQSVGTRGHRRGQVAPCVQQVEVGVKLLAQGTFGFHVVIVVIVVLKLALGLKLAIGGGKGAPSAGGTAG